MWRRATRKLRKADVFVGIVFLLLLLHFSSFSRKGEEANDNPPWKPPQNRGLFAASNSKSTHNIKDELSKANDLVKQADGLQALSTSPDRELYLSTKVQSPEEKKAEEKEGWHRNNFNQYLSDRISLHREIRDTRHPECKGKRYDVASLPDTTIIIPFHNEARTTLLRTVWTALDRSPPSLINEILLIDDASTMDHLKEPLDEEVATIPKTRIIRLKERSGLIRAKVIGAEQAKGRVVTFLDSHCECNEGWLEPLLERIALDRTIVVTPVIDNIDKSTFLYSGSPKVVTRGIFTWSLTFSWLDLPWYEQEKRKDPTAPLPSPTMAGGLFSMEKDYFFELGSYDMGMDVWGGENLEISFRIWQCGGSMEFIPCSRVGHVYRDYHPYSFPDGVGETINKNLNRVAEVWMDDYKEFYYEVRPQHRHIGAGDISERLALREKLNCKPFRWFLDNVFPDKFVAVKENVLGYGPVRNPASNLCIDTLTSTDKNMKAGLYPCAETFSENQLIIYTKKNKELRREGQFSALCVDFAGSEGGSPSMFGCHFMKGNQEWDYTDDKRLVHVPTHLCLTATRASENEAKLVMKKCSHGDEAQTWEFSQSSNPKIRQIFYGEQ